MRQHGKVHKQLWGKHTDPTPEAGWANNFSAKATYPKCDGGMKQGTNAGSPKGLHVLHAHLQQYTRLGYVRLG